MKQLEYSLHIIKFSKISSYYLKSSFSSNFIWCFKSFLSTVFFMKSDLSSGDFALDCDRFSKIVLIFKNCLNCWSLELKIPGLLLRSSKSKSDLFLFLRYRSSPKCLFPQGGFYNLASFFVKLILAVASCRCWYLNLNYW